MNFNKLGSILVALTLMWGCQNSTKNQDNQSTESSLQGQPLPDQEQLMQQAEDVTDEELTQFMSAIEKMQIINQSAQQEMVGAVQQEGMEVERFSEIMQSQQDPNQESNASSQEMEQYAEISQSFEKIQISAQQEMVSTVENEGIQVDRFNEIQQSQQDPNRDAEVSEKEMESYDAAIRELQVIQNAAQEEMQEKIRGEGLTVERYQEIISQVQTDVELQQRLEEHMKK